MYRDSQLGLCLDLTGPDGNVFALMGIADMLAKQIGGEKRKEVKGSFEALMAMEASYINFVYMFQDHFPMVTLIGLDEIKEKHCDDEIVELG